MQSLNLNLYQDFKSQEEYTKNLFLQVDLQLILFHKFMNLHPKELQVRVLHLSSKEQTLKTLKMPILILIDQLSLMIYEWTFSLDQEIQVHF